MNIKTNTWLNSNPAGLYVYRKRQYHGNTTPAGAERPMVALHFYKHSMPPASAIAVHRNKLLAEAFYLRGDIEKFGTGFFRIQTELQNSPEVRFTVESLNGFTRSGLDVNAQDTAQANIRNTG